MFHGMIVFWSHFLGISVNLHRFPLYFYGSAFECKSAAEDSLELFSEEPHSLCAPSAFKWHLITKQARQKLGLETVSCFTTNKDQCSKCQKVEVNMTSKSLPTPSKLEGLCRTFLCCHSREDREEIVIQFHCFFMSFHGDAGEKNPAVAPPYYQYHGRQRWRLRVRSRSLIDISLLSGIANCTAWCDTTDRTTQSSNARGAVGVTHQYWGTFCVYIYSTNYLSLKGK